MWASLPVRNLSPWPTNISFTIGCSTPVETCLVAEPTTNMMRPAASVWAIAEVLVKRPNWTIKKPTKMLASHWLWRMAVTFKRYSLNLITFLLSLNTSFQWQKRPLQTNNKPNDWGSNHSAGCSVSTTWSVKPAAWSRGPKRPIPTRTMILSTSTSRCQ